MVQLLHDSSPPPGRGPVERGWSIEFLRTRASVAALAVAMVASALAPAATLAADYDPATDAYSMFNTTLYTGAQAWWAAGYTGAGIGVAVIDSGVSPVPGLDGIGKLVYGPDLSLESQADNLRNLDTYGHGTFMAGLIAGNDGGAVSSTSYRGMAPDARIVSLKVATADGGVDVSQVIAAINWVVQHKNDNGYNIRVISLSYGTNTNQTYGVDPLAYAVEQAWKKGIVVVAAAGNTGYQKESGAPGLANPSYNPYVIAVGGTDTKGTPSLVDDYVASYSTSAECGKCRAPDWVTPGSHMQGLRVENSWLDAAYPNAVRGTRYFRGSGTSQAAAITSGAIALILNRFPNATPDMVKNFIKSNAFKLTNKTDGRADPPAQGAGEMNLVPLLSKTPASYTQKFTNSTGNGSLEFARGTDRMTRDGVLISGEKDIFGRTYDAAGMATAMATGSSWSGGTWNGNSWSGSSWSGSSWSGSSWSGNSWSGSSWSGSSWSGNSWSGSSWSGNSWSGSSWSGSSWTGGVWATGSWD